MKKTIVKFLKFLLRKLTKPTHYEYNMSEYEKLRMSRESYVAELLENRESVNIHGEKIPDINEIYVYLEHMFSVDMKNVPARMIEGFDFIDEDKVKFDILIGEENGVDVCDEIMKMAEEPEAITIELISTSGQKRKVILENVKVLQFDVFMHGNSSSENLSKAVVWIEFGVKRIEKI